MALEPTSATRATSASLDGGAPWSPSTAPGHVRLRTLSLIRWGAVGGQAGTILAVHYGFGFSLPLAATLGTVAASVLLNLVIAVARPAGVRIGERAAAWFLAFDVVQLAVLLYLTGGLGNPFVVLLLAPVTVSATVLSMRSTVALCSLSLLCITVLAVDHRPLPWAPGGLALPETYVLGVWVALTLGIGFFASYTWRVAAEARSMSSALAATQLALARELQLSALGGLAAAAAHELGSPLSTIAVASREVERGLPDDSPIAEDMALLISETARCRDILAELARRAEGDVGSPLDRIPVDALVEAVVTRHASERVAVHLDAGAMDGPGPEPSAPISGRSPEVLHALGNLVQNAVRFARTEVRVTTRWSDHEVTVVIDDDGPGFPARLLERLGEPYVSVHDADSGHMGLGVFIAQTLLRRTGGRVEFHNRDAAGAEAVIRWARADFEAAEAPGLVD